MNLLWYSICACAVLQAEASLVSLSNLLPRGDVEKVIVDERLEGVPVIVTRVPEPLTTIKNRLKVGCAQVICLTVEAKETPVERNRMKNN